MVSDLYFYTSIVGFCAGLGLGTFIIVPLSYVWFGLGLAGSLFCVLVRGRSFASAPFMLLVTTTFLFALSLGLWRTHQVPPAMVPFMETQVGETITTVGQVVREPEMRDDTLHFYITVNDIILLIVTDRLADVSYGDTVSVNGKLRKPESFQTDLGRTFNYQGYLRARGASYSISFAHVSVVSRGNGNILIATLLELKHSFMEQIELLIPSPQVALAEGLLLGVKRGLGEEYETAFRQTGIMHIVVLSGYNIMLVVTFFMYILAYVLPYRVRLIVGMAGITCFALLVGLSATVVRASIMASLLLLIRFGGMTHNILRALFLAGVIMLCINPFLLLYDVGFQLSFIATLALIIFAPYLENWFQWVPTFIGMREFLVATITTQLLVTPLILFHVGEVSLVAVIVNVLVLPMVPVAMLLTFIAGLIAFVSIGFAVPFAWLAHLALSYILLIARVFAALPLASAAVPAFSVGTLLLLYTALLGLLWYIFIGRIKPKKAPSANRYLQNWTIVEEK
jgi:competence protein ComEC